MTMQNDTTPAEGEDSAKLEAESALRDAACSPCPFGCVAGEIESADDFHRKACPYCNTIPLRMDAYYYGFIPTGIKVVDLILCAVASAGKAYHHTDCWTDDYGDRDNCAGRTPEEWIQKAADAAAKFIRENSQADRPNDSV